MPGHAAARGASALYLGQTALLGLAGSLAGIVAGAAVQLALPPLFPDLIPAELIRPWQPLALLRGLALGVGVALLFSLPPLAAVLRVPPARVLRRDAEPLPRTAVAGGGDPRRPGRRRAGRWRRRSRARRSSARASPAAWRSPRGSLWLGAFAVTARRRAAAARAAAASRCATASPRSAGPGAATVGAIVALGLGVLVVLGMSLVERRLSRGAGRRAPGRRAERLPGRHPARPVAGGASDCSSARGRDAHRLGAGGDGAPRWPSTAAASSRSARGDRERRWALTREQRLTYLRELPDDNQVVAGALWSDPRRAEVSVEQEFARDLGVGLGGTLCASTSRACRSSSR